MIYFDNDTSKAHFNPAVSTMFFIRRDINKIQYISYIFIQILISINEHISYPKMRKVPLNGVRK